MNSLRSIRDAIDSEVERQIGVLESGGSIVQETRGWDENRSLTISMRGKEEANDYRYFPEPDLPTLTFSAAEVAKVDDALPELPAARRERYGKEFGLDAESLEFLTTTAWMGEFFEETVRGGGGAFEAAKWLANTVARLSNEKDLSLQDSQLTPSRLGELLGLVEAKEVGAKAAQRVLEVLFVEGGEPREVLDRLGLRQLGAEQLRPMIKKLLDENPDVVQQVHDGNNKALNVLVGKVMKQTKGAANPAETRKTLEELISETQ